MNPGEEVFVLKCAECDTILSYFGYKSTLLSDSYINVYSTNFFSDKITCVYEAYTSKRCRCAIRDVACVCCGLIVGYHVEQPCRRCLEEENNGHMWMFSEEQIKVMDSASSTKMESVCFIRLCRRSIMSSFAEPER